jgi:hypothetical protein
MSAIVKLAAELNAVHVTVKDLLRASEEVHKLPEGERDWEGRDRGSAHVCRARAEDYGGGTSPSRNGSPH